MEKEGFKVNMKVGQTRQYIKLAVFCSVFLAIYFHLDVLEVFGASSWVGKERTQVICTSGVRESDFDWDTVIVVIEQRLGLD
jgi:hypothetical protein